jgi:hypothetical protein
MMEYCEPKADEGLILSSDPGRPFKADSIPLKP